jgi:hypothetical protein
VFASQRGLPKQLGKALNTYVSAAGLLATVEALHVGSASGWTRPK